MAGPRCFAGVVRLVSVGEDSPEVWARARVRMTLPEYEHVRQQDDRFAVAPGPENLRIDRVVTQSSASVVVDKIAELEPNVADDPRGAPSD
jgi:hypothetical protein